MAAIISFGGMNAAPPEYERDDIIYTSIDQRIRDGSR